MQVEKVDEFFIGKRMKPCAHLFGKIGLRDSEWIEGFGNRWYWRPNTYYVKVPKHVKKWKDRIDG